MRERIKWLDSCKGFGTVIVVLGHVIDGYISAGIYSEFSYTLHSIYRLICSFHMPLFFVLSGYSFSLAYNESGGLKRKKVRIQLYNLIWQYLFFSIVMGVFKIIFAAYTNHHTDFTDLLLIPIKPIAPYWYLYVMIFYYLIALILDRYEFLTSRIIIPITSAVSAIVCSVSIPGPFPMRNILYYSAFFCIGSLLEMKKIITKVEALHGMIFSATAVGLLSYVYISQKTICHIPLVGFVGPLVISLAVIYFVVNTPNCLKFNLFELCGRYALEIYVTHCIITAGNRVILPKLGVTALVPNIALNTLSATFIPVLCAFLLKQLKLHTLIFRPASFYLQRKKNNISVYPKR